MDPDPDEINADLQPWFLGIILRVIRLEVSIYNVYIPNQFQAIFAQGE
jgi:hypothetical protein